MIRDTILEAFELPQTTSDRVPQPSLLDRARAVLRRSLASSNARGYTMLLPDGQLVITCCRKLAELSAPPLRATSCDRLACS